MTASANSQLQRKARHQAFEDGKKSFGKEQLATSITSTACSLFLLVPVTSAGRRVWGPAATPPAPSRCLGPGWEPGPGQAAVVHRYLLAECYAQLVAQHERTVGRAQTLFTCCWEMLGNDSWRQQELLEGRSRKEPGGLKSGLAMLRAEGDRACPGVKIDYNG